MSGEQSEGDWDINCGEFFGKLEELNVGEFGEGQELAANWKELQNCINSELEGTAAEIDRSFEGEDNRVEGIFESDIVVRFGQEKQWGCSWKIDISGKLGLGKFTFTFQEAQWNYDRIHPIEVGRFEWQKWAVG